MKIKFLPASISASNYIPTPNPAKKYIPDWYKSIKPIKETELEFNDNTQITNFNVKHCVPYLDALCTGYVQELWTDILVEPVGNEVNFKYATDPAPISTRDRVSVKLNSDEFYPIEFIWQRQWAAKLPKGYSLLITHPLNRIDLPFQTLSAVVDADNFVHQDIGNIPFYIKKDFTGIIPAGTPMYQIFPFKRDNWNSEVEEFNELDKQKQNRNLRKYFLNSYKKQFWQKKSYD